MAQWGVSEKQAYRDVRALRELGVVEYVGPRKTGEWRLISGWERLRPFAVVRLTRSSRNRGTSQGERNPHEGEHHGSRVHPSSRFDVP